MLIYKTLGADAQNQFAQTWGVGYGLNNASEWQEVFQTAAKAALLLVVLDMLRLTKNSSWFEEHGACSMRAAAAGSALLPANSSLADARRVRHLAVDFVTMQAVLFNGAARSWWAQTRTLVKLQSRLTDD